MNTPRNNQIRLHPISRVLATLCGLVLAHNLACSAAVVFYVDEQGGLFGFPRADVSDPVSALQALATPPPGLSSSVPAGTKVEVFSTDATGTTIGFSEAILSLGMDDLRLQTIFDQVQATLMQFGVEGAVRVQSGGRLLSDYLPPAPSISPRQALPADAVPASALGTALAGRSVSLSPGHGKVWTGSSYAFERPVYCAPLNREDDHNLEGVIYLNQYLTQDGAVTKVYRCLDKSYGTHAGSGEPWWRVSAGYWIKQNGYPCSVYASYTGQCSLQTAGTSASSDSLRSRPLASDYDNTDIYVSLHSNGYQGDCYGSSCPNGTCTYYDTSSEHATWGAISRTLATDINNSIVSAIRTRYGDTTWRDRGALDANGAYAETRIPNRAAALIELGFHDSCDRDGLYLQDNFFRSTTMWAVYKGVCDYFNVTPTWDYYSDELVSHDIPVSMIPGQTATVHITFRNRGVLWNDARSFRLGAVGNSDPFTTTTRYNVGAEIAPGATKTFTLTLTAPGTPGTYTTDWRMVRDGVTWFGDTLTVNVNVSGVAGAPTIISHPLSQTLSPGGNVNFSVVATGSEPLSYQWRKNGIDLSNGGNISGAVSTTLAITSVQQTNAGTYTVLVSNTNGSTLSAEAVLTVGVPGMTIGSYTINTGDMNSTSRNGSYASFSPCGGLQGWYSYGIPQAGSNCTVFDRDIRWIPPQPTYGFTGRGYLTASAIVPDSHASATANFFAVDASGNDLAGPISGSINECIFSCSWVTFFNGSVNVTSFGGWRSNTKDDGPPGDGTCGCCPINCGTWSVGYSQMRIQAARWHYVNDWTCLGGYASSSVSDTANRAFAWDESGLYLYPALDTSHGNAIGVGLGLNGKTPGAVTTGDCNNANVLDFKGNASAYGNGDNMDSYGFAWVFAPAGASPRFTMGSDDGNRVWVNGSLVNDNNAARGLTRDQDTTSSVSLPVGWSRVLLKVHNGTGSFQGTVSLRNGSNSNLNEPSVNVFDLGGYYSYGIGYEQNSWYPFVYVTDFCGGNAPAPGADFYTNSTTVTASGSAEANGPVPFWQVMHYEWGYGLGGDTDYAAVSSGSNTWSHTQTGVTGHRRFHFFAVSKSGRTSFQNSGQTGGANWAGGGAGTYMDVFVDNLPPQVPGFSSATVVSPNQVDLTWPIPLDQGVGTSPGADEAADETSSGSSNYYRVGDVGVEVYRDGEIVSDWGTNTAASDIGLEANTAYSYTMAARDNNTETRGLWHNAANTAAPTVVWTLSVPPAPGSITPDLTNPPVGGTVTWTAANGFGAGQVQYYRYAWDTSSTHTWTDADSQWSSGTLATVPSSAGTWYLHVKGYNGADVANGTFDYSVTTGSVVYSQTNTISAMVDNGDGTITLSFLGTPQAQYYLVTSADPDTLMSSWQLVPNSTNTAPSPDGVWSVTVTNDATQRFYRAAAVNPAP